MTIRSPILATALAALLCSGLPGAGNAQNTTNDDPPSNKIALIKPGKNPDASLKCSSASAPENDTTLRIGVRRHARPFSYHSDNFREVWSASPQAPLALGKYTGYMSKICDAVIADMLLTHSKGDTRFTSDDVCVVDVDDLAARDKDKPRASRFEYLGTEIDILCDPATITNERRHGFILSPPLFLSGIGLIGLRSNPLAGAGKGNCPKIPLIGYVDNTNAARAGIPKLLEANEFKSYTDLLRAYVKDQKDTCVGPLGSTMVVKAYPNHKQAAEAFCAKKFFYYIGDREIITYNARNIPGCGSEIEGAGQTYSNDRYAIYGKMTYAKGTEIRDLRIARFFEILSQKVVVSPSLLDTAYENTFFEKPSRKLEAFYWNIRGPSKP